MGFSFLWLKMTRIWIRSIFEQWKCPNWPWSPRVLLGSRFLSEYQYANQFLNLNIKYLIILINKNTDDGYRWFNVLGKFSISGNITCRINWFISSRIKIFLTLILMSRFQPIRAQLSGKPDQKQDSESVTDSLKLLEAANL